MLTNALSYLENNFTRFIHELIEYSQIPSISFPGFPAEALREAAEWTAQKMRGIGLEHVQFLEVPGSPACVYGDWLHAEGAPTLLLYAHYDVQPPGRAEKWLSPPFQPEQRNGRLYGRGVVDDKAGALMHLFALESYLATSQKLPLNIRFIIEGEEETGSKHLPLILEKHSDLLKSDAMVLTDTANLEEGLPSLTYRLRGLVDAIVEVKTLDHPVHSGMWGGPPPDALSALTRILRRLTHEDGGVAIPHFSDDAKKVEGLEKARLEQLPFDENRFRQELGSVANLQWMGDSRTSLYEKIWCQTTVAILGIDAPSVEKTSNQIVESARAKVSVRIVSGMDPQKSLQKLCEFLAQDPPWGAEVRVIAGAAGSPWYVEPQGPAYEAAVRALKKGYDREPVFIGCGGSIPFVEPLTKHFGGIPALLIGLEDPICNAHGENESLSLSDWKKGIVSALHLFSEDFKNPQ